MFENIPILLRVLSRLEGYSKAWYLYMRPVYDSPCCPLFDFLRGILNLFTKFLVFCMALVEINMFDIYNGDASMKSRTRTYTLVYIPICR